MSGPPVPAAEWATDSVADSAADSCDESEDPSAGRAPAHEATGATRLDVVLVRRGLARSRSAARDLLDAGRGRIAGVVTAKPSQSIDEATPIEVIGDRDPWVGRAAYKLIAALDTFRPAGLDVVGRRALDVGASTGGFTQVLLAAGAHQVVALDVGHGQ